MSVARLRRIPSADVSKGAPLVPYPMISIPCYGGMMTMQCAVGLCSALLSLYHSGVKFEKTLLGNESLITRARNKCVSNFLKSKCTHLMFVDADIGWTAKDLDKMVRGQFDVTVGAYPMKRIGWNGVAEAAKEGKRPDELAHYGALYTVNPHQTDVNKAEVDVIEKNGAHFVEVLDGSTGFMLLTRHAVESFIAHYKKYIEYIADYEPDAGETHHMVFQADRDPLALANGEPARYLSEDYFFCRRWQMMGGKVYLCLDAKLQHVGTHVFDGDVSKMIEPVEPAAAQ